VLNWPRLDWWAVRRGCVGVGKGVSGEDAEEGVSAGQFAGMWVRE